MHTQTQIQMDYNTQRKPLSLPEYGRNIQQMVDHLLTIEDREKRTKQAQAIIRTMLLVSPHLRNQEDYERRLWDHLHFMANFKLDVDSHYPMPTPEEINPAPDRVPYPSCEKLSNHYGNIVPAMLNALAGMADESKRLQLAGMTANQMKRNYLQWNKNAVEDSEIIQDVKRLSQGRVELPESTTLTEDVVMAQPSTASKKKSNRNNRSAASSTPAASAQNGTASRNGRRRRKKKR